MQNRIKRHFILAGEAATDRLGIVKNCEQKCGAGNSARACFYEAHAARAKVPAPHNYCWAVGGVIDGRSLRGAT